MTRKRIVFCFLVLGTIQISKMALNPHTDDTSKRKTYANLTAIDWAHAVNSQKKLNDALNSSIDMIEADIVLGTLINNQSAGEMPVMGHPPENTSDISLKDFLLQILEFNTKNRNNEKGVKLDFKSTIVFDGSLDILAALWSSMNYPIWLNADIISGPVNQTEVMPVDPKVFFEGSKRFPNAVLSVGWTTRWGFNYNIGSYTEGQINEMINAIKESNINNSAHPITFPVRAGIAAHSLLRLSNLVKTINKTNSVTLTVWSSPNDHVDIERLREFILTLGVDKIYLDVPEEVSSHLNLGKSGSNRCIGAKASIFSLSLLIVAMIFTRYYLKNTL